MHSLNPSIHPQSIYSPLPLFYPYCHFWSRGPENQCKYEKRNICLKCLRIAKIAAQLSNGLVNSAMWQIPCSTERISSLVNISVFHCKYFTQPAHWFFIAKRGRLTGWLLSALNKFLFSFIHFIHWVETRQNSVQMFKPHFET